MCTFKKAVEKNYLMENDLHPKNGCTFIIHQKFMIPADSNKIITAQFEFSFLIKIIIKCLQCRFHSL